jgi:hypothetical protein
MYKNWYVRYSFGSLSESVPPTAEMVNTVDSVVPESTFVLMKHDGGELTLTVYVA